MSKAGDVRVVVSATVAMRRGQAFVVQCCNCGTLAAIPGQTDVKLNQLGACPTCAQVAGWTQVHVPAGPFKPDGWAA